MEILQANDKDLIEILYLLKVCIADMNKKGLKHWNSAYPDAESIKNDLAKGVIYVLKDKGVCKGMVTLNDTEPEEYRQIKWSDDLSRPLYLHRMAIHPKWQGLGLARELIDFADEFARRNGYNCIRLDVFSPSDRARQLYEKQDFRQAGTFHASYQRVPYVCYEKLL
ncbi:MAG: GNAT family N-acetyltransferase [Bacteroidales bacterium]|nr:GNAT family N-acetyltransferase [Bacteroidales bacterium]